MPHRIQVYSRPDEIYVLTHLTDGAAEIAMSLGQFEFVVSMAEDVKAAHAKRRSERERERERDRQRERERARERAGGVSAVY